MSIPNSTSGYLDPSDICSSTSYTSQQKICAGCSFDGTNEQYATWVRENCPLEYSVLFYDTSGSYDPSGARTAKTMANSLLTRYQDFNSITSPGQPGFNEFQNALHQFCNEYGINPGVCQNYLVNMYCVESVTSDSDANYISWCGCLHSTGTSCATSCNTSNTIRYVDPINASVSLCDKNICVIDNVSVTITDSNTNGVTVNQICPGCVGNCVCVINDVEVIGGTIDINQYCGSDRICYSQNQDNELVEVPCSPSDNNYLWILTIIVIIVLVVLAISVSLGISSNRVPR